MRDLSAPSPHLRAIRGYKSGEPTPTARRPAEGIGERPSRPPNFATAALIKEHFYSKNFSVGARQVNG